MNREMNLETHLVPILIYLIISLSLGAFATGYVIEFWVEILMNKIVEIPFWACLIASPFVASIMIPIAVITLFYLNQEYPVACGGDELVKIVFNF